MKAEQISASDEKEPCANPVQLCLWAFMGTMAMLFMALISAYIVRRSGSDWQASSLPSVLGWNTLLLIPSIWTMGLAKKSLSQGEDSRLKLWLLCSLALSVFFLLGQAYGWKNWVDQKIFVTSNPYCAFFYLFSTLHAVHVLGGVLWLGILLMASMSSKKRLSVEAVHCASDYWLFLAFIWLGLFAVLKFF